MRKVTMKEQVLQFVESKGSARFTEIQKFIVNSNFGEGTYEAAAGTRFTWKGYKTNPYRGYYSSAFTSFHSRNGYTPVGYFLKGANRLVKMENGQYCVIRESK